MGVVTDPFPQITITHMTIPDMLKPTRPRFKVDLFKTEDQKPRQQEGKQAMRKPADKKGWPKITIHNL